jgi:hypothetical protein
MKIDSTNPSGFVAGNDYDGNGPCTPTFPPKHGPILGAHGDGVEVYAASGGSITCPEGTNPHVETDGKKVVVTCDDPPLQGPKPRPKAPILE